MTARTSETGINSETWKQAVDNPDADLLVDTVVVCDMDLGTVVMVRDRSGQVSFGFDGVRHG